MAPLDRSGGYPPRFDGLAPSTRARPAPSRAGEVERTRIERDLHDGVQPRLVSVAVTLGLAQQKIDDNPAAAKAALPTPPRAR